MSTYAAILVLPETKFLWHGSHNLAALSSFSNFTCWYILAIPWSLFLLRHSSLILEH